MTRKGLVASAGDEVFRWVRAEVAPLERGGWVRRHYDCHDRLVAYEHSNGYWQWWRYQDDGLIQLSEDSNGRWLRYEYSAIRELTALVDTGVLWQVVSEGPYLIYYSLETDRYRCCSNMFEGTYNELVKFIGPHGDDPAQIALVAATNHRDALGLLSPLSKTVVRWWEKLFCLVLEFV